MSLLKLYFRCFHTVYKPLIFMIFKFPLSVQIKVFVYFKKQCIWNKLKQMSFSLTPNMFCIVLKWCYSNNLPLFSTKIITIWTASNELSHLQPYIIISNKNYIIHNLHKEIWLEHLCSCKQTLEKILDYG